MTCGFVEFCNEDFPTPPRLPPPPPILSYYFEDNKLNSTFYCDFCSNLEASLDPLHTLGNAAGGKAGGLLSPSQNITLILLIVAMVSAALGSVVTMVWRKWFRCRDGGILSKAFGASHSSHSADISSSPEGRRRSRTASLGSGSALQNLQKRLSSSSFISRRSIYPHHAGNIISQHGSHLRTGGQSMSNNTYCECPSSMMMMVCPDSTGGGNNSTINNPASPPVSTTTSAVSLSPCLAINPTAPTASTLSINTSGNVYAELDPVSTPAVLVPHGVAPPTPLMMPMIINPNNNGGGIIASPTLNQYVVNHRRRQPAPLPPIPTSEASIVANNALNISNCANSTSNTSSSIPPNILAGINHGSIGVIPSLNGFENNQMEMNDLNDIYYSDLDCKQIQF
ncbi:hypothetical protein Ocin01_04492 [Orchesella cincta]|uniref:Uncharacterized protein n=1 Tax=Orchesella cincta TaxID=48709 RepID=A0A1D2NAA8_ORCCI|nr:hypothetical protein Ocin01_04492 [Orchesella cincta]